MGYNMSTNLTFNRIHICHHCGHLFDYKIQKHLAVNDVSTESNGVSSLQAQASQAIEKDTLKVRCPNCKQYQNSMMYKSMACFCFWGIILLLICWIGVPIFTSSIAERDPKQYAMISYCVFNLILALLILIPIFLIQGFFRIKPAAEFVGDGKETYQATRKYYRSLQLFLICTFPMVFIPWLGSFLGLITLLICFFRVYRMPSYIAHQGFPLFSKDIDFHR